MKNIPALTGIRFVAAFMVFFSHFPIERLAAPIFPVAEQGYSGVTLFFVLSGFIICINYFDRFKVGIKQELPKFLVARFARVYPLYGLSILYGWIASNMAQSPIYQLLAIQSWHSDIAVSMGINGPAWSVSVELFLYLTFPILFLAAIATGLEKSKIWLVIVGASIILVMLGLAIYFTLPSIAQLGANEMNSAHRWLYRNPAARILDFMLGGIAGLWYLRHFKSENDHPKLWAFMTYASVASIVACMSWSKHLYSAFSWDFSFAVPGLLLIVALACNPKTVLSRFLSCRLMVMLGEISYAFYLFHTLLRPLYKGETVHGDDLGAYLLYFLTVIAIAYGLHKMIEAPLRLYITKTYANWIEAKTSAKKSWPEQRNEMR